MPIRVLNLLVQAAQAESDQEVAGLARQFLAVRQARRQTAELSIVRQAGETSDYGPVRAVLDDPDFESYAGGRRYWNQQLGEVRRMTNRAGEVRFYYSGFAQAVVLDRLLPGWQSQALTEGVFLEDLLRTAAQ